MKRLIAFACLFLLAVIGSAEQPATPPADQGGLPSGGDVDDVVENTSPGKGAWVDPSTITVGAADALSANPAACTGSNFVNDIAANGTLTCNDPLSGRSVEDLTDVNDLRGGATGIVRTAVDESVTTGHALCYAANGSTTSCGQVPGGAANVEDHATACSDGQGYIAASGGADCAEMVTDAELAAVADLPEALAGEVAVFGSVGAVGIDWTGYTYASAGNNWTETQDALGHWRFRSQGDTPGSVASSLTWMLNNLICYEPEHTFRLWLNPHCSDASNETSIREGWKCTDNPSCQGVSSKCVHDGTTYPVMWDQSPSPDTFNWITQSPWPYGDEPAVHDFGEAGTIFPLPMALERGHSSAPVHEGSSAAYPTCTGITMTDAANYWIQVVSSTQIRLYQDDGDLVEEVSGDDGSLAVDCTTRSDWQTLALRPRNPDGSDPTQSFLVSMAQGVQFVDSDTTSGNGPWRCVMGTDAGSNCTDHWEYNGTQPDGCASGICLPANDAVSIGYGFAVDGYEGVESSDLDLSTVSYVTGRDNNDVVTASTSAVVSMIPGECLQAIGYVASTVDNDLDTFADWGSLITITEAQRSGPTRIACSFTANSSVGIACQRYAMLTNRDAAGAVELELSSFSKGMDFCAVNETGNTFAIDPNGTERFLSPATDTNGDKLTSATEGDAVCAHIFADGKARVYYNSGGWNDGGP